MLLILNRRQEVLITSAANPFVYLMNKHFTEALTSVGWSEQSQLVLRELLRTNNQSVNVFHLRINPNPIVTDVIYRLLLYLLILAKTNVTAMEKASL